MRLLKFAFIIAAAAILPAAAQNTISWDTSGNSMLSGKYFFRQVVYQSIDSAGVIGQSSALYGTITFDGNGSYSVTAQLSDSKTSGGAPQAYAVTGNYGISASGFGYIDSVLFNGESIYGSVGQGVFVGSSTEGNNTAVNDVFVAIPAGNPAAPASAFQGKYWFGFIDFPNTDPGQVRDALFTATANGSGAFTGLTNATGFIGGGTNAVNQSMAAISYTLTDGEGTLTFPAAGTPSQTLISGAKVLYVSGDGNFAIGGSASGYDLFFALRAPTESVTDSLFKGMYYVAGVDEDNSTAGSSVLDTFYEALNSTGGGVILRDTRLAYFDWSAFDLTWDDYYTLDPTGSFDSGWYRYGIGANGNGYVAIGIGPVVALNFGVRAPDFSGTGAYLNPTGVVSAASFAPFIGGVAPGEFIYLYGTGLANTSQIDNSFPTTLAGVQVKINGISAPVYSVTPNRLDVLVPFEVNTADQFAAIQVTNNGVQSNTVTVYLNDAAPGIFSLDNNGIGYAAALHADYSVVNAANPAKKGETILVYLTGLGASNPAISTGTTPPANPTAGTFYAYIDGTQADTSYVGLAPGLPGLYQINVVVPASIGTGDVYLEVDADSNGFSTSQVMIPVSR